MSEWLHLLIMNDIRMTVEICGYPEFALETPSEAFEFEKFKNILWMYTARGVQRTVLEEIKVSDC